MTQLEARFYPRSEIAEITGRDPADSKHFKRNIENTLSKWGYGFDYMREGVTITHIPSTPEERLKEILVREYSV